ncbi:MAG TPA: hypothetical protein VHC41_02060 [Mycobacteriales bacterium]|jgi:TolB protein|nr:hypothetical protein [Mycobacteriales bacterium]
MRINRVLTTLFAAASLLLGITGISTVALAAVGTPAAQAAFPGGNAQIALANDRSGVAHIYGVNPDTGATTQLTDSPYPDSMPAWSPDGRHLAFMRTYSDTQAAIWTVNADGSDPTQLTTGFNDDGPQWSPDGTKILFQRIFAQTSRDIMVMNADGNDLTQASPSGLNYGPDWAPDSSRLLFTHFEGVITSKCKDSQCPSDDEIYVVNADGSGSTNVTNSHLSDDTSGRWSPDGAQIAFQSTRSQEYFEIFTMNADGTDVLQRGGTDKKNIDVNPVWSPDGTALVFMRGNVSSANKYELYTMNANGSGLKQLTDNKTYDGMPEWSPDGTKILFDRYVDSGYQYFTIDADGSNEKAVTGDGHDLQFGADWQPFVNGEPGAPGAPAVPR